MTRWLAGIAAIILLGIGGFMALQGRAEEPVLPAAPEPRLAAPPPPMTLSPIPQAPSADPKSKEEMRFARADKDENGRITLAELVEPRRKAFAKLDVNQDGRLAFEEWAVKTIGKFDGADADDSKALTPAEFATTAPKRKPKPACRCG
ncbi:MAG TPA: EF-hand domain-containing protein [Sphingomicrobium sp.]|nr:EF-hand domain-containing protein [Sphingomicrobium sp.]